MSASPQIENDLPAGGWIKLYRAVIEKGWLTNHKLWAFWCYCLLKASHKEHFQVVGNQQVHLQPGEFIFGRKKAATDIGMSEKEIRTCVKGMQGMGNIRAVKRASKYTVFSVVNWDTYQGQDAEEGQQEGQQTGRVGAGKGPDEGHKQEVKKLRKKKDAPSPEVKVAIDYFFQRVEAVKGFKPKIETKDAAIVKRNLKTLSIDQIKNQIDFFLSNGKSEKYISLTAALSSDTYNLYMAQKSGKREFVD